jgi:hypothetical protein
MDVHTADRHHAPLLLCSFHASIAFPPSSLSTHTHTHTHTHRPSHPYHTHPPPHTQTPICTQTHIHPLLDKCTTADSRRAEWGRTPVCSIHNSHMDIAAWTRGHMDPHAPMYIPHMPPKAYPATPDKCHRLHNGCTLVFAAFTTPRWKLPRKLAETVLHPGPGLDGTLLKLKLAGHPASPIGMHAYQKPLLQSTGLPKFSVKPIKMLSLRQCTSQSGVNPLTIFGFANCPLTTWTHRQPREAQGLCHQTNC